MLTTEGEVLVNTNPGSTYHPKIFSILGTHYSTNHKRAKKLRHYKLAFVTEQKDH